MEHITPRQATDPRENNLPLVIGVTGHRDLLDADIPLLEEAARRQLIQIRTSYHPSPLIIVSPLAEGADRLVARVAIEVGARLVVPLPFDCAEYEKDFASDESRREFKSLLGKASRVFEVPVAGCATQPYGDESGRDRRYAAVGRWVAGNTQILLALWDGCASDTVGGTSSVVDLKLGRSRDPVRAEHLLDSPEYGPVYHIITPHASNRMPFGAHFSCVAIYPMDRAGDDAKSLDWRRVIERIVATNRAAGDAWSRTSQELVRSRSDEWASDSLPEPCLALLNRYAAADALAKDNQHARHLWLLTLFVLGILGVAAFVFYDDVLRPTAWGPRMLYLYVGIFGAAYAIFVRGTALQYERHSLEYRALAEGFRVQFYWLLLGFDEEVSDHYLRKQRSELDWIRIAIRNCMLPIARTAADQYEGRVLEFTSNHWVERQLDYYERTAQQKQQMDSRSSRIAKTLVAMALGASVVLASGHAFISENRWLHNSFTIGIVLMLAIAGAVKGYSEKLAFGEEAKQYCRMAIIFRRCHDEVPALIRSHELTSARAALVDLGKEALRENADWVLLHLSRPAEVPV